MKSYCQLFKVLFLYAVMLSSFTILKAQQPISIVSGDMPVAGNNLISAIDTIPSGINPGNNGSNQLWDFSTLTPNLLDTANWMLPSATPYNSTFGSNSNLAVTNNDTNYLFFNNTTASFRVTGAALWIDTLQSTVATTFTGTNNLYIFPTNYNGNHTNSYGFVQNVTIGGTPINITFNATYFDTIDAWGIVQTPLGYYEALRQKRVERNQTVVRAFSVITVSDTRDTTTDFNFIAKESKGVLVDFQYDSTGAINRISYSTQLPKPIARFTNTNNSGNYQFTNTTYNTNGTTYSWSFGDGSPTNGQTNPNHTYAQNGQYTVCLTATNNVGSSTYCVTINVSGICPTITPNVSTTNATCNASDGIASVNPSGGTTYTYLWSNNATTASLTGLAAGSYTVTITDNGSSCSIVATANINNAGAPTITNSVSNVDCYSGSNGAIDISVSGGATPYSYLWSNTGTSEDLSNLTAGDYTVSVIDNSNCLAVQLVTVTQPDSLYILIDNIVNTNTGNDDGSIAITVLGGAPSYDYIWSDGSTSQNINSLSCGTYNVTVIDANNCSAEKSATVDCLTLINIFTDNNFFIYPNPTHGMIVVENTAKEKMQLKIVNALGEELYSEIINDNTILDCTNYVKGIYIIQVQNEKNKFSRRVIIE